MKKRTITKEDIQNLDPSELFQAIIGCKGIEVATEILVYYYDYQSREEEELTNQEIIFEAFRAGFESCRLLILGEKQDEE